uniref:Salivary secreted peptide n=1 Tax=Caenorhabditis tropicalis TaxID=1561998 RepID=A0A1I7UA16_9PELO
MLGLLVVLASTVLQCQLAPVGPNYDNIQYLHNFTLTYANNSLEGLGAIDNMTDVNPQMAQSLKSAINLALPGYLSSSRTNSQTATPSTMWTMGSMGSTMGSTMASTMVPTTGSTMQGRKKRQATSTTVGSSTPSTTPSSQPSTTQPYGTDEEFYARTDLVHFRVDINDLEGSGTI